ASEDPHSDTQRFHVRMETALVGLVEQDNTMALIQEDARWKVQWLPSLLFKQLSGDNLIRLFPKTLPRGDIVDRNGAKLATQITYTSVGFAPAEMDNAPAVLGAIAQ